MTKLLQQALDALNGVQANMRMNAQHLAGKSWGFAAKTITDIEQALAQQEKSSVLYQDNLAINYAKLAQHCEMLEAKLAQQEQPAQEPVEIKQIAKSLQELGLTLVKTVDGYKAMKFGPVTAFSAPTQPALKDDIGVACLETMVKTMTNLGLATDASLEGFGARLESNIYAMCRAVDGLFKAQPAQEPVHQYRLKGLSRWSDGTTPEGYLLEHVETRTLYTAPPTQPALSDEEILAMNAGEVFFSESPSKYPEAGHGTQYHAGAPGVLKFSRAIEAHCRGGANK